MTSLEKFEQIAHDDNVKIVSYDFSDTRFEGMYCDGLIALSKDLKTSSEKADVLAEELGHHYTSSGDILDLSDVRNRKQERKARLWAYNCRIGLSGIIQGYHEHCQNRHELAEHLDVSEEFLQEALECYREKYGISTRHGNYIIIFEPSLAVIEKI